MTLDDFNKQILRPSLLKAIKAGRMDNAIQDVDCKDIIDSDPELKLAVENRLKEIAK